MIVTNLERNLSPAICTFACALRPAAVLPCCLSPFIMHHAFCSFVFVCFVDLSTGRNFSARPGPARSEFWSARPGPLRFFAVSARPGPLKYFLGPTRPGPFKNFLGPARPDAPKFFRYVGPAWPGPLEYFFGPPGPLKNFVGRPGPPSQFFFIISAKRLNFEQRPTFGLRP